MYHEWGDFLRVLSCLGRENDMHEAKRNFGEFIGGRLKGGGGGRLVSPTRSEGAGIYSPMEVAIGSRLHWGRHGW